MNSNLNRRVGYIIEIGDGIARVYGLNTAGAGELVEFETEQKVWYLISEEDNVGVVLMGKTSDIKEGGLVKRTKLIASIPVGEGFLAGL